MLVIERFLSHRESKLIRGVEKTGTNCRWRFYKGVHLVEVSNKRESTALSMKVMLLVLLESCQKKITL